MSFNSRKELLKCAGGVNHSQHFQITRNLLEPPASTSTGTCLTPQ